MKDISSKNDITLYEVLRVPKSILIKEYNIFKVSRSYEKYSKEIKEYKNGYKKPVGRPKIRDCSGW